MDITVRPLGQASATSRRLKWLGRTRLVDCSRSSVSRLGDDDATAESTIAGDEVVSISARGAVSMMSSVKVAVTRKLKPTTLRTFVPSF